MTVNSQFLQPQKVLGSVSVSEMEMNVFGFLFLNTFFSLLLSPLESLIKRCTAMFFSLSFTAQVVSFCLFLCHHTLFLHLLPIFFPVWHLHGTVSWDPVIGSYFSLASPPSFNYSLGYNGPLLPSSRLIRFVFFFFYISRSSIVPSLDSWAGWCWRFLPPFLTVFKLTSTTWLRCTEPHKRC